ncbi:protein LNK2 isoform X2 [Neltuma alba]|uniref:protein LNK2-like isoform X1 n=1 Tax=Neltuma alba TaxID=207710 RepID=UPI0010A30250|nr:protein LNK2-like isoform X1 [Prosopis alba]XP_028785112.1 protein LNK2-like isoform X2 [Prosopis alba]XP_028788850.1 protein LNK2-like isoform X1 [Prosopis alba]XP_028788851.1 protein LNK2-like isoform X2 [Prosopis alba]
MFDWNDEELANIIWGDATESDDHIVPFPEGSDDLCNKKEWNQEAAGVTLAEQKKPEANIDFHGKKIGNSSNNDNSKGPSDAGYGKSSWPDSSLSSAAKTDQGTLGTEVSKSLSEISKHSSSKEEAARPDKDVEYLQNEHQGKEQGDFIDYGWANIGSFDDLDRIFSNDDPIFSHVNIDNGDELWSSKDESNGPAPISVDTKPPGGLSNRFEPSEIKVESVQCDDDQSYALCYDKITGPVSQDTQNAPDIAVDVGYAGIRSKLTVKERLGNHETGGTITSVASGLASENGGTANELTNKAFEQKNLLKAQKKSQGEQEEKVLQNYGSWSPSTSSLRRFESQLAPSATQSSPSPILGQQKQLQGAETLYQNIMSPYVASPVNENLTNTYMPLLSQAQSEDLRHQALLSGYEVSSDIVNPADSVKPLAMTPQEKIEKLRRRQQLQAMLAIQKQQQQLGHQVLSNNESIAQKCPLEMQSHSFDGTDARIEDLISLPAPDHPPEQDDSNTMSVPDDDYFDEDAIIYRLQDIISKLDIKIRLCIRDSLFRLAQSAMQRHHASDTSSTNKSSKEELEVVAREESNFSDRSTTISNAETETNPIDRTVAHLLFHRPLELRGNHRDKLKSPLSANMQCENKSTNLENLPLECLLDEDLKSNQPFSLHGFKNSSSMFEAPPMEQLKKSPCVDTSENASTNKAADVGVQELEASQ